MQRKKLTPAPMLARLVVVDCDRVILLKTGANSVGRLPHNDVVVDAPQVSRRHCIIVVHPNGFCHVEDNKSKRGTRVNGERVITPRRVRAGDEIHLGDYRLVIQDANSLDLNASIRGLRHGDWSYAEPLAKPF